MYTKGMKKMNKKGFVTSALLYGILSVYIVLVVGTVSIIGNRKLATDKIKQSALDDVQNIETNANCFEFNAEKGMITKYRTATGCTSLEKNVSIPGKIRGTIVTAIGSKAFQNAGVETVTLKSNVIEIYCDAFSGNTNVLFITKGNMPSTITSGSCPQNSRWGATDSSIRQD